MGISIADALFQPGFRFHPTDEELVLYYLKRKICRRRLTLDIISETDVYKWDPQDLPGLSKLKTGDRQWFFFSPRDRKYPNGGRSSRATQHGYWKATGKDRIITCNSRTVGIKKTLVFYTGRAPSGIRTDWVMHEYTLDENELKRCPDVQDYYALYKLFKKSGPGPKNGEQYGAPFKEEDWVDDDLPIINQLSNEVVPVNDFVESVPDQTLVSNYEYLLAQLMSDEEPQSTLEYPEVTTSASNSYKLGPHVIEEDFLEDFLEINDLIGPEPTEKPINEPQNLQLDWSDGLCEFDLFENAAMFGSVEQGQNGQNGQNSQPLMNQTGNEMLGPTSHSQLINFEDETVSFNHQQWSLDQSTMEANQGTISIPNSSSGVINEGISGTKQNQIMNQDNDSTESSWFSSALWSFVESIPTNPALAADNALINKASRVNKVKLSNRNANVTPSVTSALGKSKNGLVVFSILGVLCAFLCVFVGTFDTVS